MLSVILVFIKFWNYILSITDTKEEHNLQLSGGGGVIIHFIQVYRVILQLINRRYTSLHTINLELDMTFRESVKFEEVVGIGMFLLH